MTLKRSFKTFLLIVGLIFPLVWLYTHSELNMSRKAHEVDSLLLNVIQVDTEITENILKTRSQLTLHYDDISDSQHRLKLLLDEFEPLLVDHPSSLEPQLNSIAQLSLTLDESIEKFKAINAQVSQRQHYIKFLADELKKKTEVHQVHNIVNKIVITVFHARIFGYRSIELNTKRDVSALKEITKGNERETQRLIDNFLQHLNQLLSLEAKESLVMDTILKHDLRQEAQLVRQELVTNQFKMFVNGREIQRYLILYASFLVLLIIFFIVNRLNLKNYALQHKKHSERDHLTQLRNRRVFIKRLEAIIEYQSGALLFIDLDGFKIINDDLGHSVGDETLKNIAQKLVAITDKGAFNEISADVFRLGGDEFVILIEYKNMTNSVQTLDDFANMVVEECVFRLAEPFNDYSVSVSVGIAQFPEQGKNIADILNCADKAMYYSKQHGRSRYTFYSDIIN